MIPKIIHYCWLSGEKMPELVQSCIKSWKVQLKDYEFMLWDTSRFDIESHPWVKETFLAKKYAFAADYIRLYALYNFGGIYLDTDVEVLKPFDEFLDLPYFIGEEKSKFGFEAATFGAEKGTEWLNLCLLKFENRPFNIGWGKYDQTVLPELIRQVVEEFYKLEQIESISDFSMNPQIFYRFPSYFFSPKDWFTKKIDLRQETYSIHHFDNSWKRNLSLKEFIRFRISKMMNKSVIIRFRENAFKIGFLSDLQKK